VTVGFNGCTPSPDEALDQPAARGAKKAIVITLTTTAGGEHSKVDVPTAIERAQERHLGVLFLYAWSFEIDEAARFLAAQIARLV
jgi:sirohydrochlorin ferrochelatase